MFHFVVSLISEKQILSGDNEGGLRSRIQVGPTGIHRLRLTRGKAVWTYFG